MFPAQRLECPDPTGCPVTPVLPRLRVTALAAGTPLYRVHDEREGTTNTTPVTVMPGSPRSTT